MTQAYCHLTLNPSSFLVTMLQIIFDLRREWRGIFMLDSTSSPMIILGLHEQLGILHEPKA
jgi:hypothetical protein